MGYFGLARGVLLYIVRGVYMVKTAGGVAYNDALWGGGV